MTPKTADLFRVFGRIGLLSFGGPAAQISLMHNELVDRHKWLTEQQFLQALSFCMLLPGPEAMQLATYAGWRLRGVPGGLLAGLLFVVPGALVILALAWGYALFGDVPFVQSLFLGIKAAVVVIVLQALLKLCQRALNGWLARTLALGAFAAIFFLGVPFPLIIATAALVGLVFASAPDPDTVPLPSRTTGGTGISTLRSVLTWAMIWATPVLGLWAMGSGLLLDLAIFFSKLAVVTFGGAYAVLAYMTQEIVQDYQWITTAQMIDALGLAETTPGPLILVTQFVGFLAGYFEGGAGQALLAAGITLWVTFVPCFLWIFTGAPYIETLLARPRLKGAFDAISASVVGVILNLSVWFSLNVFFGTIAQGRFGPAPDPASFSVLNAGLVGLAALLLLWFRLPMLAGLAIMAAVAGTADQLM